MTQSLTVEQLFSKVQQEKATGELLVLQKDFYALATALVDGLKSTSGDGAAKQRENAEKLLASLRERRVQKLLTYLAYNKQLPQPMPQEEEALYNEIRQILNKETPRDEKISRFRIIAAIPEVLTASGRKIGPFSAGEVVEVTNGSDAEFIAKNRIGESVA